MTYEAQIPRPEDLSTNPELSEVEEKRLDRARGHIIHELRNKGLQDAYTVNFSEQRRVSHSDVETVPISLSENAKRRLERELDAQGYVVTEWLTTTKYYSVSDRDVEYNTGVCFRPKNTIPSAR